VAAVQDESDGPFGGSPVPDADSGGGAEAMDATDADALFDADPAPAVAPPLALYRRYRPDTFADVIGQEHVTEPLQRALVNNRVNHAYLFSGPRGCGKTTSARILARALNCEKAPVAEPCGECRSCRDLATGGPGSIDVIEIDAASHGGVDDARDLRERAFFAPVSRRY
jgi:DNA polymerase-3 subunit gamma/tau